MSEYFAMGGHAAYIWPAYIVAAIVLVVVYVASVRSLRTREAEVEKAEAASPRRERK